MKIKNLNKKYFFILFLVLFVGFLLFLAWSSLINKEKLLSEYSTTIIETCSDAEYRPACYDIEVPKLMDTGLSMEEAYEVTRYIQEKDGSYFYCHILGHNLSAKETAKDPSKWKDVVARSPSGMCSNGGIHGAFQERFRAESLPDLNVEELKPVLADICNKREGWDPTSLEQATCTHAIGHLAMYITSGDILKSIALCKEVSINNSGHDFTQICFDGAFMQIFQPLEPEDIGLVEEIAPKTKTEADVFCLQFDGDVYGSCHSESWPLSYKEIKTPTGLVDFCGLVVGLEQQNRCFNALFYVVTAQFTFDEDEVIRFCSNISNDRIGQCFANAASRMIETDWRMIDKSIKLCKVAEEYNVGDKCYNELLLYSGYNFIIGSDPFIQLCESMPNKWKGRCLNQLN